VYISEHLSLLKVVSGVGVARSDKNTDRATPTPLKTLSKLRCSEIYTTLHIQLQMCGSICSVVYISEHLSLLKVFNGVGVARSLVLYVVLCISRST
jgi:hypothetical protein